MTTVQPALALPADLGALREEYAAAAPWPHLVLSDVLPAGLVAAAEREARALATASMDEIPTSRQHKHETGDDALLGPATRALLGVLDGPQWIAVLEAVTGVRGLTADPHRYGAGLHSTPTGGATMVHTDFTRHPVTGWHHRTNTLLYLNSDWPEDAGGALELWPPSMTSLGQRVLPRAGTLVLWETSPRTPHGLPDPVAASGGRARLAVASYHYARRRPGACRRRDGSPTCGGRRTRGRPGCRPATTSPGWCSRCACGRPSSTAEPCSKVRSGLMTPVPRRSPVVSGQAPRSGAEDRPRPARGGHRPPDSVRPPRQGAIDRPRQRDGGRRRADPPW
ncbi:MAG: 2OG-Fe(II) oxygenase [Mycobacteriales bacterium]|nr:2OG-Fe(II) oxygenase [Mycobacteriales bacterium]